MNIHLLSTTFSLPLAPRDIPRWRAAWSELAGWDKDRFHNHRPGDQGVIYRYPLVQYRVRRRNAGLIAIQEAVQDVQATLAEKSWEITWDREPFPLGMEDLRLETYELHLASKPQRYRLYDYLPFNSENYQDWQQQPNLLQRVKLLNRLLTSHLLVFANGVGWRIPGRFEVEITDMFRQRPVCLHDLKRPAFHLEFETNLFLPPGIGLGKGVSHGFGTLAKVLDQAHN